MLLLRSKWRRRWRPGTAPSRELQGKQNTVSRGPGRGAPGERRRAGAWILTLEGVWSKQKEQNGGPNCCPSSRKWQVLAEAGPEQSSPPPPGYLLSGSLGVAAPCSAGSRGASVKGGDGRCQRIGIICSPQSGENFGRARGPLLTRAAPQQCCSAVCAHLLCTGGPASHPEDQPHEESTEV